MSGLEWLLANHPEDLTFMCNHYNKGNGSRIYAMIFFKDINEVLMEKLYLLAKAYVPPPRPVVLEDEEFDL